MSDPRVNLKDPFVAGVLAWLVPGLGHLYQGRLFKSAVYAVCILGLFISGTAFGEGRVVYIRWDKERVTLGFLSQVLVGLPSLPAVVQYWRAGAVPASSDRGRNRLPHRLAGHFEGELTNAGMVPDDEARIFVEGEIVVDPDPEGGFEFQDVTGTFKGTVRIVGTQPSGIPDGTPIELQLKPDRGLEPALFPSRDWGLEAGFQGVLKLTGEERRVDGRLEGAVTGARPIWNAYGAPLDDAGLQEANGGMGKFYELGLLFTWVAGLLNLLAIWDAAEGPAYGYGDEIPAPSAASPADGASNGPIASNASASPVPSVAAVEGRAPPGG